jgi:hydroxypyruvate isomerase
MKIAANLSMLFTELPLSERIVAAAAAGFDGVEIQCPYELPAIRLKELLNMAGMPLCLINLPAADLLSGGTGLAAVPHRQAEFDAALEEALSYAVMTRPALVNVLAGRLAEGVMREQAMVCLANNLRKTAEAFERLNIAVVTEALNPLDVPGFLINTPEHIDDLLRTVDHPNLKAQLDLYHMARQEVDIAAGVKLLTGRIGHVQFADCPGRGAPGTGVLDFEPVLKALRDSGYQGWLAAEYQQLESTTSASLGWLGVWRDQGMFLGLSTAGT